MKDLGTLMPKVLGISVCALVAMANPAQAADCPASTINLAGGTYQLTADYVRTGSNLDCFTFTGGGTVDLNGHTITASAGQDAITCTGNTTTIIDSAATKGAITGTWSGAAILGCANVKGVRITGGGANYGIYSYGFLGALSALNKIEDNFVEADQTAIYGGYVLNRQSYIRNNIVRANNTGIQLDLLANTTGTGTAAVDGNTVHESHSYGIYILSPYAAATGNLLIDRAPILVGTSVAIQSASNNSVGNYCDSCGADPDCDDSECAFDSSAADAYDFPALAQSACPGTVSGTTYTLNADVDLNATSGSCINTSTAYLTIQLNGHTITNSKSGGTAINCASTGTSVKVTNNSTEGGITGTLDGGFATGISGCRTIEFVRVQNTDIGVYNSSTSNGLDSLTSSVIHGETAAVDTYAAARTSNIAGNKLRSSHTGIHLRGVGAINTGKVDIEDNVIRESHDVAIKVTGSTNVNVHNNLMYRRDASAGGTCLDIGSVTNSHLLCDCPDDCPNTVDPPIVYPF